MNLRFIDIETTGLNTYAGHEITQFAMLETTENLVVTRAVVYNFYHEGMHWGEEAEAITGIHKSDLIPYKDEYEENLCRLYVCCARANLVGHNIEKFDFPFIVNYLRNRINLNTFAASITDTLKIWRPHVPRGRANLQALCEDAGLTPSLIESLTKMYFKQEGHAHNAAYDVMATYMIYNLARQRGYLQDYRIQQEQPKFVPVEV